jgi:hypothetical protein
MSVWGLGGKTRLARGDGIVEWLCSIAKSMKENALLVRGSGQDAVGQCETRTGKIFAL